MKNSSRKKSSLTKELLNYFLTRKRATLDELIKRFPDQKRSIYTIANRLERLGYLKKEKFKHNRRLRNFFQLTKQGRERGRR